MRSFVPALLAALLVAVATTSPPPVAADRPAAEKGMPTLPVSARQSRSLGYPWDGYLLRGVKLRSSARLRYVNEYTARQHLYGTWQLVQLLERAAYGVAQRSPGARLGVGELSRIGGGELPGHASHESGRDADLGFFVRDAVGRPHEIFTYINFDAAGRGTAPHQGLRFDVARNWELVSRLVSDEDARVQYLFVAPHLRALLLEEGRRNRASAAAVARAARVMVPPSERHPHGNHFHLRIYCGAPERPQCLDQGPYWPWYPGNPPLR
jgi:penicillin-insensitive murein DD-endopeptidase